MIVLVLMFLLTACVPTQPVRQNYQKPPVSAWERCARDHPEICKKDGTYIAPVRQWQI